MDDKLRDTKYTLKNINSTIGEGLRLFVVGSVVIFIICFIIMLLLFPLAIVLDTYNLGCMCCFLPTLFLLLFLWVSRNRSREGNMMSPRDEDTSAL